MKAVFDLIIAQYIFILNVNFSLMMLIIIEFSFVLCSVRMRTVRT